MKRICLFRNSLLLRVIFFFVAFGIGCSSKWLWLRYSAPAGMAESFTTPKLEKSNAQVNFREVVSGNTLGPQIVQSTTVDFPANRQVVVEAIEECEKFPQVRFVNENGEMLYIGSIEDKEKWLIPAKDSDLTQPELRFQVIHSDGFKSPLIMSVAVAHGGSDDAFYLTVFGEVGGKIRRLNEIPIFANIQGGYYLGYLNKEFGYGLAVWNFDWSSGAHYDEHNYEIELYRLQNGKLKRILKKLSRKAYDPDQGFRSLRELGIKVEDQRHNIPRINEFVDVAE